MKIIVCLDDKNGMAFNCRRQSRDRVVVADILATVNGAKLYIDKYSEALFAEAESTVSVSENMPEDAKNGDYCFIETVPISDFYSVYGDIEELVIYRWNRVYPSDVVFDFDIESNGLASVSSVEFEGYSHERITKEIFKR